MTESRAQVFARALDTAVGVGKDDPAELFTDDVRCWSPALNVTSLAELSAALQDRDDSLSNVTISVRGLSSAGNKVIGEWRLDADHTGPLTLSEDYTVDATGRHLHMGGATFAEFRDDKICALRSYFDDLALIEQLVDAH